MSAVTSAPIWLNEEITCVHQPSSCATIGESLPCQELTVVRWLQVICLDNFFTGSKENVKHLLNKTNFETIRHDVVEPILLEVDQIFHLACPASPIHYK